MTRLLVSARTRHGQGAAIAAAVQGRALELVALEEVVDDDAACVDLAYLSRDITGLSTKHEVQAPLAGFYRVLRRSVQAGRLRWVHTHSAGADRPIYAELMAAGVAVSTSAGANADAVAQTALAGVLALARRFPQLMAAQAGRRWAPLSAGPPPADLAGQVALVVGWGGIGRRLHAWLTMLGLVVIVARHGSEPAGPGIETVRYGALAEALPRTQWLVLACPLSPETQGLVDAAALARLPRGAMVVNVARGEVVDEPALVAALRSGQLGGAFLDVFAHEPLPADSPLWTLPGVMLTPHSAGQTAGHAARVAGLFNDNLGRWLRGEPIANRVTPGSHPGLQAAAAAAVPRP